MTDTEITNLADGPRHRTFRVVVDNDFLCGLGIFVIVISIIFGLMVNWSKNIDARHDEKRDHIEACATIENAAEKTLCLDKE